MEIRRVLILRGAAAALFLTLAFSVAIPTAGEADDTSIWERPVIPEWALYQDAPVVLSGGTELLSRATGAPDCPSMFEFEIPQYNLAHRFNPETGMTEIYIGSYDDDWIIRRDIDSALNYTETILSLEYGHPWVAQDLDLDGNVELVLQRGDPGLGGNGYLDIHSAPDWSLRQRFVFPGMKVSMNPVAVDLDADPYLELYVTPHGLGGSGRVVIIDYNPTSNSFEMIVNKEAVPFTAGKPAVGDFDNDGRIELISGNLYGHGLFEWQETTLVFIGQVGNSTDEEYSYSAAAVRPKPGGVLHALLGNSSAGDIRGFRYELIAPTGDNTFEVVQVFANTSGLTGIHPCLGADVDCDGLDELIMNLGPFTEVWEWDDDSKSFTPACAWDRDSLGTFVNYYSCDLDQNGALEFCPTNHLDIFRSYPGPECVNCNSAGTCVPPPPECLCVSHADPFHDGETNVLDVVHAVEAAFRNNPANPDLGPYCPQESTDVDCNDETDVLDVVRFVNVAFRNEDPAANFCDPCAP